MKLQKLLRLSRFQSARSEHRPTFRDQGKFPRAAITPSERLNYAAAADRRRCFMEPFALLTPFHHPRSVVKHQEAVIRRFDVAGCGGDPSPKLATLC